MLSRIAESLYWMGRYVERAEDLARILDVHVHQHLHNASTEDDDDAAHALLGVMGVPAPAGHLDVAVLTNLLAFSPSDGCSVRGALSSARENARGTREAISTEMWECLNATHNALPAMMAEATLSGPHRFFAYVKERAAVFTGLADSTMSRDDGWRFLALGRSLERVDMTARLMSTALASADERGPDLVTTLRSCSAHEAFLRTYRRGADKLRVTEFLLLDRLFPRSVFHALGVGESCLAELQPDSGRAGLDDEARRILGRARTDLEFRRVDELLADLPRHLHALQAACAEAGDAVARRFFRASAPVEWSLEGVGSPP